MINYQKTQFLLSVAELKQLPPDFGIEVALAGYSNVGKSSVLNNITNKKSLAYISKKPGCTQHINVFKIDDKRRLMDLPGYGYAKVPLHLKKHWQHMVKEYLHYRVALKGIILITDSRHPIKVLDEALLADCIDRTLPVHILLNKADKLSATEKLYRLSEVAALFEPYPFISQQYFSTTARVGLEKLHAILNEWYCF